MIVCALHSATGAGAYSFVDPTVRPAGPLVTAFDWSAQKCEDIDIPDAPARAFRDNTGQVELLASHAITRRAIGPTLATAQHQCAVTMGSLQSADPATFADLEWLSSPYILEDGRTVMALVHNEYQGSRHPGQCPSGDYFKCWFNSISLAVSTDRGATFSHTSAPPSNLVATTPYRYEPDSGPAGMMLPSNIIRRAGDGRYYVMVAMHGHEAQQPGVCVMRTSDLTDPSSWRAWNGSGWETSSVNPYLDQSPPEDHICARVAYDQIGMMTSSLTYSTYLGKFVLVGASRFNFADKSENPGFYWSTSSDLIHWSTGRQLVSGEMLWSHNCGDDDPILYPSLVDPDSPSRNFETIGRRPYLYFTQFNYGYNSGGCWMGLNRDLMRIAVEFNKPPDCSNVQAKPDVLPSMNRRMFPVTISGATEPDGEAMTVTITTVNQTQPVTGRGDSAGPDAMRTANPSQILLRAEYGASGGRMYRINVTVTDTKGESCSTTEKVYIPRGAPESSATYGSFQKK